MSRVCSPATGLWAGVPGVLGQGGPGPGACWRPSSPPRPKEAELTARACFAFAGEEHGVGPMSGPGSREGRGWGEKASLTG